MFFVTQRPKRRSIEILLEIEMTEQMNNETALQVSERNRFDYALLVMGTYVNANKILFWSVWVRACVCVFNLSLTRQVS